MTDLKIRAGSKFPDLQASNLKGEVHNLKKPSGDATWRMVVVYRGAHCPMCTRYLNKLETLVAQFLEIDVDVVAVSGDSKEQLQRHLEKLDVSFPLYYGISTDQMEELGLYISIPRSEQETDHPFAEPGLFVINDEEKVQVVDISNNPFVRPDLDQLLSGLSWIRKPENNYPIRGTWRPDS